MRLQSVSKCSRATLNVSLGVRQQLQLTNNFVKNTILSIYLLNSGFKTWMQMLKTYKTNRNPTTSYFPGSSNELLSVADVQSRRLNTKNEFTVLQQSIISRVCTLKLQGYCSNHIRTYILVWEVTAFIGRHVPDGNPERLSLQSPLHHHSLICGSARRETAYRGPRGELLGLFAWLPAAVVTKKREMKAAEKGKGGKWSSGIKNRVRQPNYEAIGTAALKRHSGAVENAFVFAAVKWTY